MWNGCHKSKWISQCQDVNVIYEKYLMIATKIHNKVKLLLKKCSTEEVVDIKGKIENGNE